jgi:hypothetical protein
MEIYKLLLKDNKWKFNGKFPEHYNTAYGKTRKLLLSTQIWYCNTKIYMNTSFTKDKVEPIPKKILKDIMPGGFYLIKTKTKNETLNKIYESLHTLYNIKDPKLSIVDFGSGYGMFRKKTEPSNAIESLPIIKKYDEFLYLYFIKIIKLLKKLYDSENESIENFIDKYISLTINKYKNNNSLGFHFDNILRYNIEGPICVISIGPEYSYLDLAPSNTYKTNSNLSPLRIKLPQGSMYIMDGESRLDWSHAIPGDTNFSKTKFSIMFKCSRFKNYKISKHSEVFNTDIYENIMNK